MIRFLAKLKQQRKLDLSNPYKLIGGLRGLLLKPFLKRCGLPVVIEKQVKFTKVSSVALGKWSRIRSGTQILKNVVLSDGVFVGQSCDIGNNTVLEENVTLADRVCILGSTHQFDNPEKRAGRTYSPGKTVIAKGAWIGYGAIVLPQVDYIGRGAIVGAGAVVTKNVPDHSIAVGNPARVIRELNTERTISEYECAEPAEAIAQ